MSRGFFEIGIFRGKTEHNLGTLWRSAYQLGATGIFTIESRHEVPLITEADTVCSWRHIPHRHYTSLAAFLEAKPVGTPIIAIETGGRPLSNYVHPSSAIYLLGAEDFGLPKDVLDACADAIALDSVRTPSYNVAVAGSIVMYDRMTKLNRAARVRQARGEGQQS